MDFFFCFCRCSRLITLRPPSPTSSPLSLFYIPHACTGPHGGQGLFRRLARSLSFFFIFLDTVSVCLCWWSCVCVCVHVAVRVSLSPRPPSLSRVIRTDFFVFASVRRSAKRFAASVSSPLPPSTLLPRWYRVFRRFVRECTTSSLFHVLLCLTIFSFLHLAPSEDAGNLTVISRSSVPALGVGGQVWGSPVPERVVIVSIFGRAFYRVGSAIQHVKARCGPVACASRARLSVTALGRVEHNNEVGTVAQSQRFLGRRCRLHG